MCNSSFMHAVASLVGLIAAIAIILIALGVMLGLVKPADALKHSGAFVGIAIVMLLIVTVLVGLWSNMPLWQRAVLAAIGFGVWRLRKERRQLRKKNEEE